MGHAGDEVVTEANKGDFPLGTLQRSGELLPEVVRGLTRVNFPVSTMGVGWRRR
jgi:hypothetical protein